MHLGIHTSEALKLRVLKKYKFYLIVSINWKQENQYVHYVVTEGYGLRLSDFKEHFPRISGLFVFDSIFQSQDSKITGETIRSYLPYDSTYRYDVPELQRKGEYIYFSNLKEVTVWRRNISQAFRALEEFEVRLRKIKVTKTADHKGTV